MGQEGDGREPDRVGAVGARRARWQGREEMAGGRAARWGRGNGFREGQITGEGGDGMVQEGQMAVSEDGGSRRRVTGGRNSKWAGS